jgi:aryl-alcohol dehydrogenase-like predicted oxidoreductase
VPTKAQFESNIPFLASVTSLESEELETLVATACESNAAFFDTAERYGSHAKTMVGLGKKHGSIKETKVKSLFCSLLTSTFPP